MAMESGSKENSDECFLKIDTIWSEADGNFESIAIKEEIFSDTEADITKNNERGDDPDNGANNNWEESESVTRVSRKKITSSKNHDNCNNTSLLQLDLSSSPKSNCLHESKGFKIVNRRLRCGDCRSLVCPECFKILHSTLHNHFLGLDMTDCNTFTCKFCFFPFQSVCALQAHVRVHTMETPYVCPDCGLIYSNAYFLILHLMNKCFHVYKTVIYRCVACPNAYFVTDSFLKHIREAHIRSVFRCSYCSLLFNTEKEFNEHMRSSHQKQKVQYLNYFRCTLCSDMVITNLMYEKHIKLHSKNSQSYEVEYSCPCGDSYGLIGAFQVHLQHCDKKGTLPQHWAFLQKNLKTQDLPAMTNESIHQAKEDSQCERLNIVSNVRSDALPFSVDEKITSNEQLVGTRMSKTGSERRANQLSLINKVNRGNEKVLPEKCVKFCETENQNRTHIISKLSNNKTELISSRVCEKQTTADQNGSVGKGTSAFETTGNCGKDFEVDPTFGETKGSEHREDDRINKDATQAKVSDSDSTKVLYDYIPCDHLGYVKTQGRELDVKCASTEEDKAEGCLNIPHNYHLVTELDEKTGHMISRKVPASNPVEERESDEENFGKDNGEDVDLLTCSNEDDVLSNTKIPSCEKGSNPKFGSSFFTCPFCVVMFPKHSSTFQQFRLHLEYYHADAALNVTVSQDDLNCENASEFHRNSTKARQENAEGNKSLNNNGLLHKSGINIGRLSNQKRKKSIQLGAGNFEGDDTCLLDGQTKETDRRVNEKVGGDKFYEEEDEKENLTKEANSNGKNCASRAPGEGFWTVKLSVKRTDDAPDAKKDSDKIMQSENLENLKESKEDYEEMRTLMENKLQIEDVAFRRKANNDKCKKVVYSTGRTQLNAVPYRGIEKNLREEYKLNCMTVHGRQTNYAFAKDLEKQQQEKMRRDVVNDDFAVPGTDQKNSHITSHLNEDESWEGESSRDSNMNWRNVSEYVLRETEGTEESGIDHPLEKPKGCGKLKRESEVWSELYESLQVAEKLKKRKRAKQMSQESQETKATSFVSSTTDYSAKRVVKKPKRYRQSSESDYSWDEPENSESEPEVRVLRSFRRAEETVEEPEEMLDLDNLDKKQKLFWKLKNIDQKFIDYLFDLITRKEKCIELYKKHSNLRANRYGQDLRSYRKKVLNGIKLRGRPLKLVRCEDPTQRDVSDVIIEKPETAQFPECPRIQQKNPENSFGPKSNEKKRGRPRKAMDASKIKERRRSDKEVDFIEKHFDREGSGTSPSKRKRKLSSKLQYYKKMGRPEEKDDFSSGQLIANTKTSSDANKKFSCAVCKETFEEAKDFRVHIGTHRLEENTYQCLECGECFVVRPSLEKHLLAFHKIKNTERYLTENQCCTPKREVPEQPEVETLKENQCKVCKDQFERAIDLTKHFRIHGMAFLKEFKRETKPKT